VAINNRPLETGNATGKRLSPTSELRNILGAMKTGGYLFQVF